MQEKEETKVITKRWENASYHETYEDADKKRKLLLSQNEGNKNFLVKVKRCGRPTNNYVVKTYTAEARESKYARKKREKAKRRQKKQDG